MAATLGLDPALNTVGYCYLPEDGKPEILTLKAQTGIPQFLKMIQQRNALTEYLEKRLGKIQYVGIEQPYVQGATARSSGGNQSPNMWAVYSMMLDVIRQYRLPVVMFNIVQFHALIVRKRGLSKTEIVYKAKSEQLHFGRIDQHSADAYFVAKNARAFWRLMDTEDDSARRSLTPDQADIFLSQRTNTSGNKTGIIWRPGDFWFDFRQEDPLTQPVGLQRLCR
jgi:hypothetical protein